MSSVRGPDTKAYRAIGGGARDQLTRRQARVPVPEGLRGIPAMSRGFGGPRADVDPARVPPGQYVTRVPQRAARPRAVRDGPDRRASTRLTPTRRTRNGHTCDCESPSRARGAARAARDRPGAAGDPAGARRSVAHRQAAALGGG